MRFSLKPEFCLSLLLYLGSGSIVNHLFVYITLGKWWEMKGNPRTIVGFLFIEDLVS